MSLNVNVGGFVFIQTCLLVIRYGFEIYSKMAEVYPFLKDECDNQLMRKLDETDNQI